MKQRNPRHTLRPLAAILLAVLIAVLQLAPGGVAEAAKKTTISADCKTITLKYNAHAESKQMFIARYSVRSLLENAKDKYIYTAVVKNKKIAKVIKNTWDNEPNERYLCSTGLGSTTADIYEQTSKKAKKKKIGTVKVKVKAATMAETAGEFMYGDTKLQSTVWMKLNFREDMKRFDYGTHLHTMGLNNAEAGVHFDKSEYTVTYTAPETPESTGIVEISDTGVFTAKKTGEYFQSYKITFQDGSDMDSGVLVRVTDAVLKKENLYTMDTIRDQIVGLDTPVELEDGTKTPLINFDNAATTPAFKAVQNEVNEKLDMYGSIGRGFSQKSNYSTDLYNNTRDKVLEFLGADPEKYTCFYVNNTTDGLNKLASALIESKDDIVLTTRIEHHANDLSWRERCKVIYAEVDSNGRVLYDDIEKLLKKNKGKVKYVSVTAASNVTGYVTDVHKVAKMAHKYGAKIIVDGAQIVSHRKFSMIGETDEENIDFIAFSAHKMYSPYGGGAVVGLSDVLNQHMPTFYGGGTIKIVGDNWQHYKDAPARYEAGSPNYPGVVGLGKAIDVLNDVGFDAIQAHEKELNRRLIDGLKKLDNIIVYGDSVNIDDRVGVVTFNFSDINTMLLAQKLSEMGGVATRRGAFCAHPYVWRLMGISDDQLEAFENCTDAKTPGMVRVSFGIYNTTEEVDRFLEILPKAMAEVKAMQEMYDAVPEY